MAGSTSQASGSHVNPKPPERRSVKTPAVTKPGAVHPVGLWVSVDEVAKPRWVRGSSLGRAWCCRSGLREGQNFPNLLVGLTRPAALGGSWRTDSRHS